MQWSPLILHQEVVADEVDDVDQRAVALDAPQKSPGTLEQVTQTQTWFRRHALPILRARGGPAIPILRARGGPERRSLGTTQQREKCLTQRLKESSPFYMRGK